MGQAVWAASGTAGTQSTTAIEKARSGAAIRINEFRIGDGSTTHPNNAFIELYNAGTKPIDISNWTLTQHQAQDAVFSAITIPAKTILAAKAFYVLGLANSGLATRAESGAVTLQVRDVTGMKVADSLNIGSGANQETRRIASLGTASGKATTVWQPLPEGPVITVPVGATNVPVASVEGIMEGQQIALGYGTTYPVVGRDREQYEIVTVTKVGKPGTQAYVAADARAGDTSLQLTSVENLTPGDQIRLDIASQGHGIETVTVKAVGTAAAQSSLKAQARKGDTSVILRSVVGFPRTNLDPKVGGKLIVGMPDTYETVTITGAEPAAEGTVKVQFTPALTHDHIVEEDVVYPGTGVTLEAPLKFNHAANLPFSARGTGITFTPATQFPHSSNEPVLPLGTGVTLDRPLQQAHEVDAVVRVASAPAAGFQGTPDQWFGGPVLSPNAGNMVLRDGSGHVVDSLNYGANVDPWAGEGFQKVSGFEKFGCFVPAPGGGIHWEPVANVIADNSAGRYPDGADADSSCEDFKVATTTLMVSPSLAGAISVYAKKTEDFKVGQTLLIGANGDRESVTIATVGSPGATVLTASLAKGDSSIRVGEARDFAAGQVIVLDTGIVREEAIVSDVHRWERRIDLTTPLKSPHASGVSVTGTGLTLTSPLARPHDTGTPVTTDLSTPGKPNTYASGQ